MAVVAGPSDSEPYICRHIENKYACASVQCSK